MNLWLLWIDLESSGRDPQRHVIMEVAAAYAPLDDPTRATFIMDSPIRTSADDLVSMDVTAAAMHERNNLIKECRSVSSPHLLEVEHRLLQRMPAIDRSDRYVLAGSSVHFDRGFIVQHMPILAGRLWHRHFDVSAMELWCVSEGMQPLDRPVNHRAHEDVLASMRRFELCRAWARDAFQFPGRIVRDAPQTG